MIEIGYADPFSSVYKFLIMCITGRNKMNKLDVIYREAYKAGTLTCLDSKTFLVGPPKPKSRQRSKHGLIRQQHAVTTKLIIVISFSTFAHTHEYTNQVSTTFLLVLVPLLREPHAQGVGL